MQYVVKYKLFFHTFNKEIEDTIKVDNGLFYFNGERKCNVYIFIYMYICAHTAFLRLLPLSSYSPTLTLIFGCPQYLPLTFTWRNFLGQQHSKYPLVLNLLSFKPKHKIHEGNEMGPHRCGEDMAAKTFRAEAR